MRSSRSEVVTALSVPLLLLAVASGTRGQSANEPAPKLNPPQASADAIKQDDKAQDRIHWAIHVLSEGIRAIPNSPELLRKRGIAYYCNGEFDKAIVDLNAAIQLSPNEADAYYYRALALAAVDEQERALADFNQAIKLKLDHAEAYSRRGLCYFFIGNHAMAKSDFDKAIKLKPDDADTLSFRAADSAIEGDLDKAIADQTEAIRMSPEDVSLRSFRIRYYSCQGDLDKSIADQTEAIRLSPEDASLRRRRGICYIIQDDLDRAISDFEAAIRLRPDYTAAIENRDSAVRLRAQLGTKKTPAGGAGGGKPLPHLVHPVHADTLKEEIEALAMKEVRPRRQRPKIVVTIPLTKDLVVTQRYAGKVVNPGTALAWVEFGVPDTQYLESMAKLTQQHGLKIELMLADGKIFDQIGKIGAIEADFNGESGNVTVRADFPNPEGKLRQGQSVTVLVRVPLQNAVVIPKRTTFGDSRRRFAYVVGDDGVVHQHKVEVRYETDDLFVTKDLDVSEKVVLTGVRWVGDGDKVEYEFRKPEEVLAGSRSRPEK